jgi:hypothetical protein
VRAAKVVNLAVKAKGRAIAPAAMDLALSLAP